MGEFDVPGTGQVLDKNILTVTVTLRCAGSFWLLLTYVHFVSSHYEGNTRGAETLENRGGREKASIPS